MSTWRDELLEASYRGVPFKVASHSAEFGRRYASHEYPQRELPYQEDLGASAQKWQIDAYVVGDDYRRQRDLLVEACVSPLLSTSSAGTLVHPYFGTRRVVCTSCRVSESTADGGMARVALTFEQAGNKVIPIDSRAPLGEAEDSSKAVGDAAETLAAEELETTGPLPDFVRDAAELETVSIGERLRSLDVFSGPAREVAAITKKITKLIEEASSLATAPADLAAQIRGSVVDVLRSASNAVAALEAYHSLADYSPNIGLGSTSAASKANRNRALLAGLLSKTATGMLVETAASLSWGSLDEAIEGRDRILAKIDELLDDAEDATFTALTRLRAAAVYSVPPDEEKLPRLEEFELLTTTPSLALAYRFHGHVELEAELLAANRTRNPALVPAGPLEVLRGPGA